MNWPTAAVVIVVFGMLTSCEIDRHRMQSKAEISCIEHGRTWTHSWGGYCEPKAN